MDLTKKRMDAPIIKKHSKSSLKVSVLQRVLAYILKKTKNHVQYQSWTEFYGLNRLLYYEIVVANNAAK